MIRHAVVVGSGIAGLLAARVLAEESRQVTVVERDPHAGAGPRRGVPQGRHLHGLLDRGRQIIEDLHPGFTRDLIDAGALTAEPLSRTRWYLHGRRLHPTDTGLTSVLASRALIEDRLRDRTAALPGVEFRQATVDGIVCDAGVVRGVRLRLPTALPDTAVLDCDLVIDASGRGSRISHWLAELGLSPPPVHRVDVDLGYVTRTFRRHPGHLGGDLAATVSTVPRFRGGGVLAIEGDRWMVTLAGMLGDHPPTDEAGFRRFAATLPASAVHEVVAAAEPLDDPLPYRFRGSRWNRFDRFPAVPSGLLALGDSVCSLNPLYAQGMSSAAQQALVLRRWLRRPRSTRAYHREIGAVCGRAWEIATRADLALPEVEGTRAPVARVLDRYVTRVQRVAHTDPHVARGVVRVANLVDPPSSLLTPAMLARVLRPSADPVVPLPEHAIAGTGRIPVSRPSRQPIGDRP